MTSKQQFEKAVQSCIVAAQNNYPDEIVDVLLESLCRVLQNRNEGNALTEIDAQGWATALQEGLMDGRIGNADQLPI